MPAAYIETVPEDVGEGEGKKRRVEMCPEEWKDTFGEDFYAYALDNSFYFLAPKTDWKAGSQSIDAPGIQQLSVMSEAELDDAIETIKQKVGTDSDE